MHPAPIFSSRLTRRSHPDCRSIRQDRARQREPAGTAARASIGGGVCRTRVGAGRRRAGGPPGLRHRRRRRPRGDGRCWRPLQRGVARAMAVCPTCEGGRPSVGAVACRSLSARQFTRESGGPHHHAGAAVIEPVCWHRPPRWSAPPWRAETPAESVAGARSAETGAVAGRAGTAHRGMAPVDRSADGRNPVPPGLRTRAAIDRRCDSAIAS